MVWFSVATPRLGSLPCAAARRWQSISQLSVRSRPPRPCVLSAVLGTSRPPLWRGIVVAGALLVVEASVVDLLTHIAPHETFGLVLLLGVLVISAGWGMGLAVVMTLASAAVYVYFHVGASGGLLAANVAEVVAIAVFVPIAALAAALVGQVRSRALEAEERRHEPTGPPTASANWPSSRHRCDGSPPWSHGGCLRLRFSGRWPTRLPTRLTWTTPV